MSWQRRVEEERFQLKKKIDKLQEFIKSQSIDPDISNKQLCLLDTQLHIMISYHNILMVRLFDPEHKKILDQEVV